MTDRRRAQCPCCGRTLAVQTPKAGDGSVDVFPRHYAMKVRLAGGQSRGERCSMSRSTVKPDRYVNEDRGSKGHD